MRRAIYDSAMRWCNLGGAEIFLVFYVMCSLVSVASAADWNTPTLQLARKITMFTGPGAVALKVENRSSLSNQDVEKITADLRVQLESLGVRVVQLESAEGSVTVFFSENAQAYVWVAEMQVGSQSGVAMISTERNHGSAFVHESSGVSLHKIPLWAQEERILDVAVLEEDSSPKYIAVLDAEKVALYRRQNTEWQEEQGLMITHERAWPRDLRGRLVTAKDHLLDVYLPGVYCRTTTTMPLSLNCRESDDPWPLVVTGPTSFPSYAATRANSSTGFAGIATLDAFYAPTRNFFTGALAPGVGRVAGVAKFYSAASLPRGNYVLWLFAGVDGQIHFVDGVRDQPAKLDWGSDIASVQTGCGSGWQLLATGAQNGNTDMVRAYEIPDREPFPASPSLEIPGEITALWTEAQGHSAIAVAHDRKVEEYEAFRVAVDCSQ
jgi:hypothetical protein